MTTPKRAAFFRAEGVLVSRGVLAATAYYAANAQKFSERALRFGVVALSAPLQGLLSQNDRTLANRIAFLAARGMSEDRLAELGEEYAEDILKDKILDRGVELIKRARAEGNRIVVLSDNITEIMEPLLQHLPKIDDLVCNHLEIVDGEATGKLLDPVIGSHGDGRWAQGYAERHDLDLKACTAYGSHGTDLLLLAAVGKPCAVNPDFTLRRSAREADWPTIEYQEKD
jgi:phosphoserine phosphatase